MRVCLPVCMLVCISVWMLVGLVVCLRVCMYVGLSVRLSVSLVTYFLRRARQRLHKHARVQRAVKALCPKMLPQKWYHFGYRKMHSLLTSTLRRAWLNLDVGLQAWRGAAFSRNARVHRCVGGAAAPVCSHIVCTCLWWASRRRALRCMAA